jgi:hypothetical protein
MFAEKEIRLLTELSNPTDLSKDIQGRVNK